jgi:hypothetical protein
VLHGPLAEILESHRRLVVRWKQAGDRLLQLPGALAISGGPEEWTVVCNSGRDSLVQALREGHGELLEETGASFEEIFHARVSRPPTA